MNTRCDATLQRYRSIFRPDLLKKVILAVLVRFLSLRPDDLINGALSKLNKLKGVRHQVPVQGRSAIPEAYALALSAILFGRRANEKREVWVDETGFESSEIRMMIVMSTVKNSQKDRFGKFRSTTDVTDIGYEQPNGNVPGSDSGGCSSGMFDGERLHEPPWLSKIQIKTVELVRRKR